MAQLKIGDKAPNFNLLTQNEKKVKLADFKGQKLLVYFYPKASTPGCTTQTCDVNDNLKALAKLKVAAVGVSPDAPDKQLKFAEKYDIKFPLLCDTENKMAEDYSVWGEKNMYGKKYMGIIRSAFLIDEKGKIEQVWYKVSPKDTVPNVIKALK